MARNPNKTGGAAQQVFRQFAWNLAGTLAKTGKASDKTRSTVRRGSPVKRGAAK